MAKKYSFKYYFLILAGVLISLLAYPQAAEDEFTKAIKQGDESFEAGDYINAKAAYQLATRLNPEDEYARQQLQESLQLLRGQIEKRGKYNSKIKIADELFDSRSYEKAKQAYEEAIQILPGESHPHEQLKKIEEIVAQEKADRESYEKAIKAADNHLSNGNLNEALEFYQESMGYIDYEDYPKEKILEIKSILAEKKSLQESYEKLLTDADELLKRKNYKRALEAYMKAAELKPGEELPRQKIADLNDFLVIYEQYNKLITEADELYIGKQYESARIKYEQASQMLQEERYPKDLIAKIDNILNEQAIENWEKYDELIAEADQYYNQEEYEKAMETYNTALRFKPDEKYARGKIKSIMDILDLRRSKEEAYTNALARADNLFREKQYEEALQEYTKAHDLKPMEQYPKVRADEIEVILTEMKSKTEIYERAIAGADKLFHSEDYEQALQQYTRALEVLPGKQYPKDQINMINDILERKISSQEAYETAIANADIHFNEEEYEDAKLDYMTAIDIKPEETYPREKIGEINNILAMLKARKEAFTMAVKEADRLFENRQYVESLQEYRKAVEIEEQDTHVQERIAEIESIIQEKEALDEQYAGLINEANSLYEQEAWAEAKNKYSAALKIKPEETYPADQIALAEQKMEEIASRMALDERYNATIEEAENYFSQEEYELALASYKKALSIKPQEDLPSSRISEIGKLQERLASYNALNTEGDQLFEKGSYEAAIKKYTLAGEVFPEKDYHKYKITEAEAALDEINRKIALDHKYDSLLAIGDNLLTGKEYLPAKGKYTEASSLKPQEDYPKEKIAEIDALLARLAKQEEIQANYHKVIAEADAYFNDELWNEAKAAYSNALSLKPEESYPQEKLSELEDVFAELEKQQALEDRYNALIAEADLLLSDNSLAEAKARYQEALVLKQEETYPKEKIALIDSELEAIAKQRALDEQYALLITEAENLNNQGQFEQAIEKFREASAIKPDDAYPQDMITALNTNLAELKKQQETDAEYSRLIEQADKLFDKNEYGEALAEYGKAKALKPVEEYPSARITEINDILERMAEEKERAYTLAITRGDNFYNEKNYKDAIEAYKAASSLKPKEAYPKERIRDAEALYLAEIEALTKAYRQLIGEADAFFNERIYDKAIDKYIEAHDVLSEEPYPMEMVRKITKIINDNAIVDINQDVLLIPENTEKKFTFSPMPVNVRKENYILVKARNPVEREFKMIVSFGKDGAKNGGVAIRIPESAEEKDFIIRLGSQYKWFSEDNNWVSVYPEGGDLEVGLIRISKSD